MSYTKEDCDSAANDLKNSENEGPNDCTTDREPSFPTHNLMSQMESNHFSREPGTANSHEPCASQTAGIGEVEVENTFKDVQEDDLKEVSDLIQIPIPRKWVDLMPGLGETNCENIILENNKTNECSLKRHYVREVKMKVRNYFHNPNSYESSKEISWKIPFFKDHEIRRMFLHLLCGRYFHQVSDHQSVTCLKQKYMAVFPHLNFPYNSERAIIIGSPFRMIYMHSLLHRLTTRKISRSSYTKKKEEIFIFLRPVLYVPRVQVQRVLIGKVFEDHSPAPHNVIVVIINNNNSWKFLCPICGRSFNSINEILENSCHFCGN